MSKRNYWDGVKDQLKRQRKGSHEEKRVLKGAEKDIIEKKTLTVQQLSEFPSGVKQKYNRVSPRVFVPYNYETLSLENIKSSCEMYIDHEENTYCDILASEMGPSCSTLSQIPKLNIIHCRFVTSEFPISQAPRNDHFDSGVLEDQALPPKQLHRSFSSTSTTSSSKHQRKSAFPTIPASITVSNMLKLGKLIETKSIFVQIKKFDVASMIWKENCEKKHFYVETKKFAEGGYRDCYKATSVSEGFDGKKWVIKFYNDDAKKHFHDYESAGKKGYSICDQALKTVQMHSLAKNFAEKLMEKAPSQFGLSFKYREVFYGSFVENDKIQHVTIEEFLHGAFSKYINNNGDVYTASATEDQNIFEKAEALVHFSYERSGKCLMLLDIQGIRYDLFDPEIASQNVDESVEGEREFTAGNMASTAISNFKEQHSCNTFCNMLNLEELSLSTDSLIA